MSLELIATVVSVFSVASGAVVSFLVWTSSARRNRVDELTDIISAVSAENDRLSERIDELETDKANSDKRIDELQADNERMQAEHVVLRSDYEVLQDEHRVLEAAYKNLLKENSDLRKFLREHDLNIPRVRKQQKNGADEYL
ncbi:MAG: hypothetical protein GY832_03755 [Chloroflexi bacterium]|nr:hypothetical protein [Chloroflexota bacterium]